MDNRGHIHELMDLAGGKLQATDIETEEVKVYDKLPNLFKMIPNCDYEEVKAMSMEQRLEYYSKLIDKEKK